MLRFAQGMPAARRTILQPIVQQSAATRLLAQRLPVFQQSKYLLRRNLTFSTSFSSPRATIAQSWRTPVLRRVRFARQNSSKTATQETVSEGSQSMSQRFKELSRKYGWAALGVYMGLSALDFPFCFLAVRLIGTDRIAEVEHAVAHAFWSVVGAIMPSMRPEKKAAVELGEGEGAEVAVDGSHDNASIWTQLLLAYGVHKSLIFFRLPLTAAVTPKIVKTLRSWGWNIGPRKRVSTTVK